MLKNEKVPTYAFKVEGNKGNELKINLGAHRGTDGDIILAIQNTALDVDVDIHLKLLDVEALIEFLEGRRDSWTMKEELSLDDPDGEIIDTVIRLNVYHNTMVSDNSSCLYKSYPTLELTERRKGIKNTQQVILDDLKARLIARGLSSVMGTLMFGV